MFEDTLLESSSKRAPVLNGLHWLISIAVGVAFCLTGYYAVPFISGSWFLSGALGAIFLAWTLMLCYVATDAGRNGFNRWVWLAVNIILPLVGFILYLVYSAARTGDWKRATLPIAYIFEVVIIGVMILIPLIYTEALPKAQLMTFLAAPPPPPPPLPLRRRPLPVPSSSIG